MRLETVSLLQTFLAWWGRELRASLPRRIEALITPPRPVLEVHVEKRDLRLETVVGGRRDLVAILPDPRTEPTARKLRRRIARTARDAGEIVLRLPAESVLRPTLRLPTCTADNLNEHLAREMDCHTPFAADEVRYDWRLLGSDVELEQLFVEMLVARRSDVENALAQTRSVGLEPDRVDGPRSGTSSLDLMRGEIGDRRRRRRRTAGHFVPMLAVAAVVTACVLALLAVERRESELEAIEDALVALRADATGVAALEERQQRLLAAQGFLLERKLSRPAAIAVLAEVSRILPDGDWLQTFSLEGNGLRMEGYSNNAAGLPALMERSEMLSNVAFDAPLDRLAEFGMDRFSITATLARGAGT